VDQEILPPGGGRDRRRRAILITGPANAKTELVKHIHNRPIRTDESIAGIETADHPTDGRARRHARTLIVF
jgi:hypothetical protein